MSAASSSIRRRFASCRTARDGARCVASKLNDELELYWKSLADGRSKADLSRYDEARRRARSLGFEYVENAQLLMLPPDQRLDRLETLVARGATNDAAARAALLGTVKRPAFPLSKLFEEYEAMTKDEVRDFSPNQLRVAQQPHARG
jgi:hypothetical protein